jgi:hypothetical protein
MKMKNPFLALGIGGLAISLLIFVLMEILDIKYDVFPYVIPWLVFIVIGLLKSRHVES